MIFQFDYFLRIFAIIFSGFKNTVSMAFVSLIFAVLLGFVLVASRYYGMPVMKRFSVVFTSFFRSTPFIAQLLVFYYGFAPEISDRVLFMDSGGIALEGTPQEIFGGDNPRVRKFAGSVA